MVEVKPERVFISYSRRDAANLALRLRDDLIKAGYHAWLDAAQIAGGTSWTREIEEALDRCTVLLALLTEASYRSECCRAEQLHALRRGKRVIPVVAQADVKRPLHLEHLHYRDLSDGARYSEALQILLLDVSGGESVPLPETLRQTYVTAPRLPPNFIPRPEELQDLRRAVIGEGSTTATALTALRGLGGIGKSVLAQALCQDKVIQEAFPDGVIWVSIGREPGDLVRQMREVGRALHDGPEHYDTPDGSANRLRTILRDKAALLLLDDVWDKRHVDPFLVEAPRCRILFTTRNGSIALSLCAGEIKLGVFQPAQAVELLREWAGRDDPAFSDIARRLGYLPLALKLAGAQLREGMAGTDWLKEPPHVSQMFLDLCSEDPTENLEGCFDLSVQRLPERYQRLYHALGIFPEDVPVPQTVIARLWKQLDGRLDDADCSNLLKQLSRLALVQMGSDKTITLHDLLYDYNRGKLGVQQTARLHNCLLDAYNPGSGPWHSVPDDAYLYRHLAYHLVEAGRKEELRCLLLDFDWLRTKLDTTDIAGLIADYRSLPDDADLRLVRDALVLSAHILSRDKAQLPGQLTGRLLSFQSSAIQGLLEKTRRAKLKAWLRPLTASLRAAGGPLVRTLIGHSGSVTAVAVTPDGRQAVTTSEDSTLKVWDLESGAEMQSVTTGHTLWAAVAVTPDGRRALSGSVDGTVKGWDLESGSEVCSLAGQAVLVNAVALTPDGRCAVMACQGLALNVWDLENGALLHKMVGHTRQVCAVAVTADGKRVVAASEDFTVKVWDLESGALLHTASEDCTLRLWDVENGMLLRTLPGRGVPVKEAAVTADGRWALTCSHGPRVRVWDLESEAQLHTPAGHADAVTVIKITADGKRAVTGSYDRTMKVWNLETGAELHTLVGHARSIWDVAVTADGRRALSGSADGAKVWNLETGVEVHSFIGRAGYVTAVAVTPDGRQAVTTSEDFPVKVWDLESGAELRSLTGNAFWACRVMLTPDGRRALSASVDGTVRVWDLESRSELRSLAGLAGRVYAVAFTPDGRCAVMACQGLALNVWDLENGALLHNMVGHTREVCAVAVTADGKRVVAATEDLTVKVWDLESGAELGTLGGHTSAVRTVAVTADGRRGVSNDGTVRVWDLGSGRLLAGFSGDSELLACIIAPDGMTVVAGEASGAMHFLRLEGIED
jgi:WD40 repeat protein